MPVDPNTLEVIRGPSGPQQMSSPVVVVDPHVQQRLDVAARLLEAATRENQQSQQRLSTTAQSLEEVNRENRQLLQRIGESDVRVQAARDDAERRVAEIDNAIYKEAKLNSIYITANNRMWAAVIGAAAILLVAVPISLFCLYQASSSAISVTVANTELAEYKQTFDDRLTAAIAKEKAESTAAIERADNAIERADKREAEATTARNAVDKRRQEAEAEWKDANAAKRKALDDQTAANDTMKEAIKTKGIADRDLLAATEKERIAKETEVRANATMQTASETMTKADQKMRDADKKDAEADVKVTIAKNNERMERDRRMGVEAMIKAGAPLQFPLEDHERNDDAQLQRNAPSPPVSNSATPLPGYGNSTNPPKRTAPEILRDVVWRWCLEKELGIEDESGNLVGEVTEKTRTGYRASLQGYPSTEPESALPWDVFEPRNLFSPTEKTREFWDGEKDGSSWGWEDWHVFRTITDDVKGELTNEMKEKLDIQPEDRFSFSSNKGVPVHPVKLDQRYLLSQTEITQELWESVMGYNRSRFKGADRPVENVSWEECQKFIAELNEMKEKLRVPSGYIFRLPYEAEWELACRAAPTNAFETKLDERTLTSFHFGNILDSKQANSNGNALGGTSVVGKYKANAWGLHDMHGNVWEWCRDAIGYGPLSVQGRSSVCDDFYRSLRGGSWHTFTEYCRSAYRGSSIPTMMRPDGDGECVLVRIDNGKAVAVRDDDKNLVWIRDKMVVVRDDNGKVLLIRDDDGKMVMVHDDGKRVVRNDNGKVVLVRDNDGKMVVVRDDGKMLLIRDGKMVVNMRDGGIWMIRDKDEGDIGFRLCLAAAK